ncbi:MAG: hypothetical protein NTU70_00740 [Methylococcales bacterium]|nr:hypothetical protein [Methylococcales bacterium]
MNEHKDDIQIEIVIFPPVLESIPEIDALEKQLIFEAKTIWNINGSN